MDDPQIKSRLMDWIESLLLENWTQSHMLDMLSPSEWRPIVEREVILHAPLLRSQLAEVRAEVLGDRSALSAPSDWQSIAEQIIRGLDKPKWDG